jgi:hypothetical protein
MPPPGPFPESLGGILSLNLYASQPEGISDRRA